MGSLLAEPTLNAAHSRPGIVCFQDDLLYLATTLAILAIVAPARRVGPHVWWRRMVRHCAACAALFRRPSTHLLASAFLLPLPFWREHCAESERGRHAEPWAFHGTQSRRVRASRDSCGFLSVFRLLGAEQFIAANHNPAEHCLCFACQNELPKQSIIIRRTHTHDQCKTYLIFIAIRML